MPKAMLNLLVNTSKLNVAIEKKKCVRRTEEVIRLAKQTAQQHSQNTMLFVCTTSLTTNLLNHYGQVHDVDLLPVQGVLQEALGLWRESRGITEDQTNDALAGLVRAGQVASVLASLPD